MYDALLIVSFGGPEGPDDVVPYLENVLRGKNVPRARLEEVAEHYQQFGGVSPINEQNRQLIAALQREFADHGIELPIYFGNRNWHPLLAESIQQMDASGVRRALAFVTSAYSSYSGCRQYREDISRAQQETALEHIVIDKLRVFFNHPGFIEPMVAQTRSALMEISGGRSGRIPLLFTAHSIPQAMAGNCRYEQQLGEACRLVADGCGHSDWQLVYQSRSGPPSQPWLEPDVCDVIRTECAADELAGIVIVPIGFISDHMEVIYDLDHEARAVCEEIGLPMRRVATVGTHPRFVTMIRELVEERMTDMPTRLSLGDLGPSHDVCPADCCLYEPARPAAS